MEPMKYDPNNNCAMDPYNNNDPPRRLSLKARPNGTLSYWSMAVLVIVTIPEMLTTIFAGILLCPPVLLACYFFPWAVMRSLGLMIGGFMVGTFVYTYLFRKHQMAYGQNYLIEKVDEIDED